MAMENTKQENGIGEKKATAYGKSLPISTKQAVEVCNAIRGRRLEAVKRILNDTIEMKVPIAFKRYNDNVGHRKGNMGPGRYPKKACGEILSLVESAEANAQVKGLNASSLVLSMIFASKASIQYHSGRRRRKMKRTNIRIEVEEKEAEKNENKNKREKSSK